MKGCRGSGLAECSRIVASLQKNRIAAEIEYLQVRLYEFPACFLYIESGDKKMIRLMTHCAYMRTKASQSCHVGILLTQCPLSNEQWSFHMEFTDKQGTAMVLLPPYEFIIATIFMAAIAYRPLQ